MYTPTETDYAVAAEVVSMFADLRDEDCERMPAEQWPELDRSEMVIVLRENADVSDDEPAHEIIEQALFLKGLN